MAPPAEATHFGGLRLGDLEIALPLAVLREVQRCPGLRPMPAAAAGLAGGAPVGGALVPVVDLRAMSGGAPAPAGDAPLVVYAVHDGLIVGLLADAVTGVFACTPEGWHPARAGAGEGAMLAGSVERADGAPVCSVIDVGALLALPGMPAVIDPEPQRVRAFAADASGDAGPKAPPLMWMHCGGIDLAIDAIEVHSAVPQALVRASPLAGGACVGVVAHGGLDLPAVDLPAPCGLADPSAVGMCQAIVLMMPTGPVALLIGVVRDVLTPSAPQLLPVPALALARPDLFRGVLAPDGAESPSGRGMLVLDGDRLRAEPLLVQLAETHRRMPAGTAAAGAPGSTAKPPEAAPQRALVTYELGGEAATPIAQVCEILPCRPVERMLDEAAAVIDVIVERGRSIPVLCLSRLVGLPPPQFTPAACVLVVESAGERIGFAVPRLDTIETGRWEPSLPLRRPGPGRAQIATRDGRLPLVLVGEGDAQRLLQFVDLQRIAADLQDAARRRAA